MEMKELLKKYENKPAEIIFNWKDPETEAEGWTVINSLRGGAAGGGAGVPAGPHEPRGPRTELQCTLLAAAGPGRGAPLRRDVPQEIARSCAVAISPG